MNFKKNIIFSVVVSGLLLAVCNTYGECTKLSRSVTLNFGVEVELPDPNFTYTIDYYHTDIEVAFTQSGWAMSLFHDAPGTDGIEIDPNDGLLNVNANARWNMSSVPSGYEFIGIVPGEDFWILPQHSAGDVLPLGFCTEASDTMKLCQWDPNDVAHGASSFDTWYKIQLLDVRGPQDAEFSVWQTSPLTVYISTVQEGITEGDVFYISSGAHSHVNWGFTKQGYYQVDLLVTTIYQCDESLAGDVWPRGAAYCGDCMVDLHDFNSLAQYWLQTGCNDSDLCQGGDISSPSDGQVNLEDMAIIADHWLQCGYPGCGL